MAPLPIAEPLISRGEGTNRGASMGTLPRRLGATHDLDERVLRG
ncbi:hypothetical protein RISK_005808 [Rhodopirellula islandica]|uniref:Uncharacterized protein n=1 Tax=Rhodopirellula islandica TaxID=595434 RepID=A0A0J1B6B9_RHOIS|nr:hypothetical protein RISK_005808 [Rhodopirellula islandica]